MNQQRHNNAFSNEMLNWIVEARILGWSDELLKRYLLQNGFSELSITELFYGLNGNPVYQAASRIGQRYLKAESLLKIQKTLHKESGSSTNIDRRSRLSAVDFRADYYLKNIPVIITDLVKNWAAYEKWTPAYFKAGFGHAMVEIMAGREGNPDYDIDPEQHKQQCNFGDYIDQVMDSDAGNDCYLVANNRLFKNDNFKPLLKDLLPLPEMLDEAQLDDQVFLWLGTAGTITPLHHDELNVLFVQLMGSKRFILISPEQGPYLYNDIDVFSRVDAAKPDLEKFPLFGEVEKVEVILQAGEVLFLPVGWWHQVIALEKSISLSFTNFRYPNAYEWQHPNIK